MRQRRRGLRCCAATALLLLPAGVAADWNTTSGGNAARNGRSPGVGPSRPTLRWAGGASATLGWEAVAAGELLVTTRNTSVDPETGSTLSAQRLTTGGPLWTVQLPWDVANPGWYTHVTAVRDGRVYATRAGGCHRTDYYYALDGADGSIVWRSQDRVRECPPESAVFTREGDLIVGDFEWVTRINGASGATVWRVSRSCPTTNGCGVSVFGDRGYIWEPTPSGPRVAALDLATGARLYGSAAIGGGFTQQLGLLVGPDGTVYAPRSGGNPVTDFFVAFTDTGTALVEKWRVPMGFAPRASFGVGRDGSVYSCTVDRRIARLHPATGVVLGTSPPVSSDANMAIQMAIDRHGTLFVADGESTLYSFDPDLTLRGSVSVPSLSLSPAVLASDGTVVVAGGGTDVRAYRAWLAPTALAADPAPAGNGVLEPGETAVVAPSWRNQTSAPMTFTSELTAFSGPAGGTYEIVDGSADYGTLAPETVGDCAADCLQVRVTAGTRPALHWDASARELVSDGEDVRWTLHVGESFADVPRASPFYRFVEAVLHHSVTGGCTADAYCPLATTSREQMAVFVLAAAEGKGYQPRACVAGATRFADVPAASAFCRWIEELARRAIVSGCGGGNYCPSAPVARDQTAVFTLLAREAPGHRPPDCIPNQELFSDVPAASPFCRWVEELARGGVVGGCGGGAYCPAQPVTREQMAVFISRTFDLGLYGP